jgi:4-amino-4-deoxy-L-arabinose transferase-like glycosyltransferase
MDHAQIARNLARGEGFTTDYIRPFAIWQLRSADKAGDEVDVTKFPDFSQAPLSPFVSSFALRFLDKDATVDPTEFIFAGDRIIAALGIVTFLLSLVVLYFVGRKLFDDRLALLGCAAVALTDLFWQWSLSGLPQMLLLLIFSLACLTTLFAMDANEREETMLTVIWLAASGLFFGLTALANGIMAFVFVGWLIFAGILFRPRGVAMLAALGVFAIVVTPWLVRNYQVCGNPLGISAYAVVFGAEPETGFLRQTEPDFRKTGASVPSKIRQGTIQQITNLFPAIGLNVVAVCFLPALLHPFRNPATARFRWGIVAMWVGAVLGMALFGWAHDRAIEVNQLQILFVPVFVFYGLAFLLVLWNRLEFGLGLLRNLFIAFLLFLCAIPMLSVLLAGPQQRIHWPPYVPPFIAILGEWFEEDEIICSDMPWAVAWYANRKSLLLPETVREFNRIHDYRVLKLAVPGLYLTPITGNQRLFSGIYKGPYREWAPLITRPAQTRGFPLAVFTPLPIDAECIIFADSDRWNKRRN